MNIPLIVIVASFVMCGISAQEKSWGWFSVYLVILFLSVLITAIRSIS